MSKIIHNIIFLLTIAHLSWSQAPAAQHFEVATHAPRRGVGLIKNASELGFAGLYYQSGSSLEGYVGYVGTGSWIDTSTFQVGSFNKPIHFLPTGQRTMTVNTTDVVMSTTLHVDAGHDVLYGASTTGAGKKLLWLSDKAAFRAGEIFGTHWDDPNVGQYSTAFGSNNRATNNEALAFGSNNLASGIQSTAFGFITKATANQATSFGIRSLASANGATAWGDNTKATSFNSTAWGKQNGSSGHHATAWGEGNIAQSKYETVIGSYADTIVGANAATAVPTDHLFVVGNGTSDAARSNALTVYKNGNTRIAGALNVDMTQQFVFSTNTLLDVGSKGYLRLQSTASIISPHRVTLSDGSQEGQLLFLSCIAGGVELFDSANVNLVQSRTLGPDDTLKLLWDGTQWLELSFSSN